MRCLVSLIAALALAGCSPTLGSGLVKPQLPSLPAKATAACGKPIVKVGDDLGVAAARFNAARACEAGRRTALINYYANLKTRLGR